MKAVQMKAIQMLCVLFAGLLGTAGAATLTISEDTTWTDLSALEDVDGVSIDSGVTLTIAPASGVTLSLTKPISGAGNVTKDNAGTLELRAANTFDGTFIIGGTGDVYAYNNAAFGSTTGETILYERLYTDGAMVTTQQPGAALYLCGITTDENFKIYSWDVKRGLFAKASTVNILNGSVQINGSQVDAYALANATLRFTGGISSFGSSTQFRPSTATGGKIIIDTKPLTIGMWNSVSASGTFLLAAPKNSCGYTYQPITLGCDWAFDGASVNWSVSLTGTDMKIDLNGYENRVQNIATTKANMNGWVTSTGKTAFLHYNSANTIMTTLPFRGYAGLFHEGSGTTTLTNNTKNASDTAGALCVTNGTVVFAAGHAWPNVSLVTLSEKGKLTLNAANQLNANMRLELSGDSVLTLPANAALPVFALMLNGVWQEPGTYTAAQLGGHLVDNGASIVVVTKPLDGYAHIFASTLWDDTQLAALTSDYAGIQVFEGATLTLSNSTAYTLSKPIVGSGSVVLDGTAQFNLNTDNPLFEGAFDIKGLQRAVYVNTSGAFGTTAGSTTVRLSYNNENGNDGGRGGVALYLNGITTDENFFFKGNNAKEPYRIYAMDKTTVTFNGNVNNEGSQISYNTRNGSAIIFNGSFTGSGVSLSPNTDTQITFNCPCKASLFNSHYTTGSVLFNTTGNTPLGYFGCTSRFGVDYAWDGVDCALGMQYSANGKVDLCGHPQRGKNISYYNSTRALSSASYITDTTGSKTFFYLNTTSSYDSYVYFKGTAGLYWEGTGTVTFKANASTSSGDLTVANGRVVFDTGSWLGGDFATVKSGAVLEVKDAANFAFHHLVVEEGGKVILASGTMTACDVTLGGTTYPAGSTINCSEHTDYFAGSGEGAAIACSGDYIITVDAENADTVETNTVAIPANTLRVVKRGKGTAHLKLGTNAATSYEIVVEAGVLGVASKADIGALLNTGVTAIRVQDGGTFELGAMNNATAGAYLHGAMVYLAGDGAQSAAGEKLGAIRRVNRTGEESGGEANRMFATLVLTDDARVHVQGYDCGCAGSGCRQTLNGHTLTKTGAQQFYWGGRTTPGNFVVAGGNLIFFESPTLEGCETNTIRATGGTVMFNNCTAAMKPVPHTLICDQASNSATLNIYQNYGQWAGPWVVHSNLTVNTATKSPSNGRLTMENSIVSTNCNIYIQYTHPTLVLTGTNRHDIGSMSILGAVELRNSVCCETHPLSSGAQTEITIGKSTGKDVLEWGYPAQLVVSNATFTSALAPSKAPAQYGKFVLAWSQNNGGEMVVQEGSVVTGALCCAQSGLAAIRQSGGEFVTRDTSRCGGGMVLGCTGSSYACLLLSGGCFDTTYGAFNAATWRGCTSILRQEGGWLKSGSDDSTHKCESLSTGAGYLSSYQSGGVFSNESAVSYGYYTSTSSGGRYEVTVTGENTYRYDYWDIRVSGTKYQFIDTNLFYLADGAIWDMRCLNYGRNADTEARRFYVGFGGGILRRHFGGEGFLGAFPDRVTLYKGGLIVETSAVSGDLTIGAALRKPTGKVVTGVTLPTSAAYLAENKYYLGPAKVTIEGGAGDGATAVTDFDEKTRALTGVRIAMPGFDYAADDGVKAYVEGPFKTNVYECAVTLADPDTTGGLTKRGVKMLSLTGANDYAGVTRIEGGQLRFTAGAYPAESDVEITAEAVNAANGDWVLSVANFPNGRTVTILGAEKINLSKISRALNITQFSGTLPTDVTVKALDSNGNPYTFADGYSLYYVNGKVRLGKCRGTILLVN